MSNNSGSSFLRNFFWGVGAILGMIYGAILGAAAVPNGLGGVVGLFAGCALGAIVGRAFDNVIARIVLAIIGVVTLLAERAVISMLWQAVSGG